MEKQFLKGLLIPTAVILAIVLLVAGYFIFDKQSHDDSEQFSEEVSQMMDNNALDARIKKLESMMVIKNEAGETILLPQLVINMYNEIQKQTD